LRLERQIQRFGVEREPESRDGKKPARIKRFIAYSFPRRGSGYDGSGTARQPNCDL
jgi:hypothetical protein